MPARLLIVFFARAPEPSIASGDLRGYCDVERDKMVGNRRGHNSACLLQKRTVEEDQRRCNAGKTQQTREASGRESSCLSISGSSTE